MPKNIPNHIIAAIIETFMCSNENQIQKIAKHHNISYHTTYKIIDCHLFSLAKNRNNNTNDRFEILKSKLCN